MATNFFLFALALCAAVAVTLSAPYGGQGGSPVGGQGPWFPYKQGAGAVALSAPYPGPQRGFPVGGQGPWFPYQQGAFGYAKNPCGFCPFNQICWVSPHGYPPKCKCPFGLIRSPGPYGGCIRPVPVCYPQACAAYGPGAWCEPTPYLGRPYKCVCPGPYGGPHVPCGLRPVLPYPQPFIKPYVQPYAQPFVKPFIKPFVKPFVKPFFKPIIKPYPQPLLVKQPFGPALKPIIPIKPLGPIKHILPGKPIHQGPIKVYAAQPQPW